MNTCVADDEVIINIQGIRYVNWGESTAMYSANAGRPWFLTINYKGNHQTFHYKTEAEARAIFVKVRDAMTRKKETV